MIRISIERTRNRAGFDEKDIKRLKKDVSETFNTVKEEMEDHLQSINENTDEIQANYEYIKHLNNKIQKLTERIDNIHLFFKKLTDAGEEAMKQAPVDEQNLVCEIQPLSSDEKKLFLVLYTRGTSPLSYSELSERLAFNESLVRQYVTNLIEKGIPVIKEYRFGRAYVKLDKPFIDLQAKKNVVKLTQKTLTKSF